MSELAVLNHNIDLHSVPELAENSLVVLERRYLRKGLDGSR